jgi:hypothetical protein
MTVSSRLLAALPAALLSMSLAAPVAHATPAAAAAAASAPSTTPAAMPASSPVPAAPVDPRKQALIDRLLKSWHPEALVVQRVRSFADNAINQSRIALQQARLPQDKMDKDMKDIVPDVQKYVDDTGPLLQGSIQRNAGPAVASLLASQFSLEELQQLVAMYESPITAKFSKLQPDLEKAVGERVQADVGPQINKEIDELTKAVGLKLRADLTVN